MIRQLASGYRATLNRLAAAWLTSGARGVSLWQDGNLVAAWPPDHQADEAHSAPIYRGRRVLGELRVVGVMGAATRARLEADAALLGDLATFNEEVDSIAAELIEAQDQLLALYRLNQATGSALHTDESLKSVACEAAGLLKAEAVCFALSAEHPLSVQSWRADGNAGPVISSELCTRLAGHDEPQSVLASAEPSLAAAGVQHLVLIPLQVQGTLIAGVMGLVNGLAHTDAPTLKRAQAVANLAGSLIERGMLYQDQLGRIRLNTEMDLARTVQQNLLPQRPPTIGGLDIFARAIPALHVGGDFYDFVLAQDGSLVFSLGDVTGKGIPAAIIMAMTRTALRTKATFLPRPEPLAIIARANQDLYDDFTLVEMFATVIVGQILPREQRLRIANAGHAPVILQRAGEEPRLIEAGGIPLGVLPDPVCELQSEPFAPGDLLVVASDGITEAQARNGDMFGLERLLALIYALAGKSATVIGEAIFAAVADYSRGQPQSDDQTLMVLRGVDLC